MISFPGKRIVGAFFICLSTFQKKMYQNFFKILYMMCTESKFFFVVVVVLSHHLTCTTFLWVCISLWYDKWGFWICKTSSFNFTMLKQSQNVRIKCTVCTVSHSCQRCVKPPVLLLVLYILQRSSLFFLNYIPWMFRLCAVVFRKNSTIMSNNSNYSCHQY